MPMIEEIDVAELQTRIASGEKIRLIDVRTQAEWDQGIIENGEFMPLDTVPAHLDEFSNDVTNIIYCRSGMRSAQACMFLEEHAGITAINVKGGIIAWHHSGGAVIRP
ncbi:rhodanese-like domain-containing protein [Leucothrix arctica]|uniref:Sulfurtransferase n=1 Tax=Leucothrix arctica TaxID=1481894 RepID=A0A317CBF9_9GAMM|nr:rhodanese-like domain-containing protein [Leucothrix arctica]PWQ94643.1 sulfurtransferase [Leucothrix arctica]